MAGQQGGYRQPRTPAPVSGPGALSKRTDGGPIEGMSSPGNTQAPKYMPGLGYGKSGQNMINQESAPLAGNPVTSVPAPELIPLSAPTMRPNEPITTGVNIGPGPGSEVMPPMPNIQNTPSMIMRRLAQFDDSGMAELLYRRLADSGN